MAKLVQNPVPSAFRAFEAIELYSVVFFVSTRH